MLIRFRRKIRYLTERLSNGKTESPSTGDISNITMVKPLDIMSITITKYKNIYTFLSHCFSVDIITSCKLAMNLCTLSKLKSHNSAIILSIIVKNLTQGYWGGRQLRNLLQIMIALQVQRRFYFMIHQFDLEVALQPRVWSSKDARSQWLLPMPKLHSSAVLFV